MLPSLIFLAFKLQKFKELIFHPGIIQTLKSLKTHFSEENIIIILFPFFHAFSNISQNNGKLLLCSFFFPFEAYSFGTNPFCHLVKLIFLQEPLPLILH